MAEGAPLLREYVGKTCIEGSNPSGSAKRTSAKIYTYPTEPRFSYENGAFFMHACLRLSTPIRFVWGSR